MAPVAAVLTAHARSRGARALTRAVGAVALASLGVELIQLGVPGRHVEPWDVLLNTLGAALASAGVLWVWRRGASPRQVYVAVAAAVLLTVLTLLVGTGVVTLRLLRMEMWDPAFPILTGDEASGRREYRGSVWDARLCAGTAADTVCAGRGANYALRDRLGDAAERSQRIEVSAHLLSASDAQRGPARIVTFSRDSVFRNVTLGQEARTLELRIRSVLGGENGSDLLFRLPSAVRRGDSTFVWGSYSPTGVRLAARSRDRTVAGTFPVGILVAWRFLWPGPLEPADLRLPALAAAAALALPLGLALAWCLPGAGGPAVAMSAVAGAASLGLLELGLGTPVHAPHAALVALLAAGGYLLGRRDRRRFAAHGLAAACSSRAAR